ncbi:glycosyl transferase group 1 [Halosimplex carlsbadense 2-9-1]|uniref:Glycosyl transferase group 1 n=1 Tax=Halosimplex carlsbadense 2-9-1 TaxID=797114 RepID=M0CUU3_9EURY|nr:glycosyltransferase [Halosimplex carlsbadense]ELZ26996.1 glycosyl transferase group 1 [Halosimplex carlsbadense 2-9-1]
MARVAVLHNTLDFQGGADAVCLAVCEALAPVHDVTLLTVSETDPAALADRFGFDLGGVTVRIPPAGRSVAAALSAAAPRIGPQLAARSALLREAFERVADRFDCAVSTANELALSVPSVQYVHYPQFHLDRLPDGDPGRLNGLWSRLAAPTREALAGGGVTLLANSSWTADVVAEAYGVRPSVLHPPVDPIDCDRSWADREAGIVAVGRLAPDKRALDAVRIVDGVRERGHDCHLHIVGSAPRAYRDYADRVAAAAAERPYVGLERDVSRDRLEHLLCTHRYGLNTKPEEHFGMSVAEYVAAGMVAFAPDSGGQRDVLDDREDRLFDSVETAVDLVSDAIEADARPTLARDRFARERFADGVREAVAPTVD